MSRKILTLNTDYFTNTNQVAFIRDTNYVFRGTENIGLYSPDSNIIKSPVEHNL